MIQASAVRQQIKTFSIVVAPLFQFPDAGKTAVVIAVHIIAVEIRSNIIHSLYGTDLHIDRGTDFQSGEVRFEEFADQRRGGRYGTQQKPVRQIIHGVSGFFKKRARLTVFPVAVSVQQQIQPDSFPGQQS